MHAAVVTCALLLLPIGFITCGTEARSGQGGGAEAPQPYDPLVFGDPVIDQLPPGCCDVSAEQLVIRLASSRWDYLLHRCFESEDGHGDTGEARVEIRAAATGHVSVLRFEPSAYVSMIL